MFRIGLMGCGSVADFGHAPAILATPGLELSGVFDPDHSRVRLFQEKFGVAEGWTDEKDFLASKYDAVVIASPSSAHLENATAAARAGMHVLCEKPLSDTKQNSEALAQAVRAEDRMLFTAFVYRFSQTAQQIRSWIQQGIIGEVRILRLVYNWNLHGRFGPNQSGQWMESRLWRGRMLEGGPLVDCGVHQIDLARWWLQSEIETTSSFGCWVADYEAPDHLFLHMVHANGVCTNIEVSFTYTHTAKEPRSLFTYEIIGTGGVIRFDREGYVLEARHGNGTIQVQGHGEKDFAAMYRAFEHALRTGETGDLATPEDGIIATSIAVQATENAISLRNRLSSAKK